MQLKPPLDGGFAQPVGSRVTRLYARLREVMRRRGVIPPRNRKTSDLEERIAALATVRGEARDTVINRFATELRRCP